MKKSIEQIRADFPILSPRAGEVRPWIYLDTAATAQKPESVIETVNALHRTQNANIHRSVFRMAEEVTVRYEAARERIRAFIGAENTREIVFTGGATESINLVAYSFGEKYVNPGDNIILTEMEHHSNIVPWQLMAERKGAQVRVIPFNDDGSLAIDRLPELMDEKTRIIAVTQASNVLGTQPDLEKIISLAHAQDIPVLVDGCQGIVHGAVNVRELDCDFYAFSGHKLYGPTGIGILYGKEKWLAALPPYKGGGDMIATVKLEPGGTTFAELPLKFEAGTANYIGAIGLAAAIDYFDSVGTTAEIRAYEHTLLENLTRRLSEEIEGIRIYGTTADKGPIVSFGIDGIHPKDIGELADQMGLAMRTGMLCAEPIMAHYGITVMCRLSIGLYNTLEETDLAVEAIKRAARMLK